MNAELFTNVNGSFIARQFGGSTFSPRLDEVRLTGQLARVRDLMADNKWRTLAEISEKTGDPESSVSARLRDLRKVQHGLFTVERRRRTVGQYEYQMRGRGI